MYLVWRGGGEGLVPVTEYIKMKKEEGGMMDACLGQGLRKEGWEGWVQRILFVGGRDGTGRDDMG